MQDEVRNRKESDNEIKVVLETSKRMLLESINQKTESVKALTKALINEETAERARNFEQIHKFVNNKQNEFQKKIEALLELKI